MTATLSVAALQVRLIWVIDAAVAVRFDGAVGACVSPLITAALNAASCMTHAPAPESGAAAVCEPTAVTTLSSKMSPSGVVMRRLVKPVPAPIVDVNTSFAPTIRSLALVVVTAPLLLLLLVPVAPMATSSGLVVSMPLYSAVRMSGKAAPPLKLTVIEFVPAAMFFA